MVKGFTDKELLNLFACSDHGKVFVWQPTEKLATLESDLPWTHKAILCQHKKFIFRRRNLQVGTITRALADVKNRIRWRLFFLSRGDDGVNPWLNLQTKTSLAVPCPHFASTHMEQALMKASDTIVHTAEKFLRTRSREDTSHAFLLKYVLRDLKEHDLQVLKSDKDSSFVLVPRGEYLAVRDQAFERHWYSPPFSVTLNQLHYMCTRYVDICKSLSEVHEDPRLWRVLTRDLPRVGSTGLISRLMVTIKTHKPDASIRAIHNANRHPFKAGMRFIAGHLRRFLSEHPFVVRDSVEAASRIRALRVPPGTVMMEFDIGEYFMAGAHSSIASNCAKGIPEFCRREGKDLIEHVLSTQLVNCSSDSLLSVRRTEIGTGMGLVCSGEMSDTDYMCKTEIPYIGPELHRPGSPLVGYLRFRDDGILFLHGLRSERREFCHKLQQLAWPYKLIFKASRSSSVFLDLQLDMDSTGHISIKPFFKPLAVGTPLSDASNHPVSVHRLWPLNRLQFYQRVSTHRDDFYDALGTLVKRIYQHAPGHRGLQPIRAWLDPTSVRSCKTRAQHNVWMRIPFSAVWQKIRIAHIFRTIAEDFQPLLSADELHMLQVGIAWSKADMHASEIFEHMYPDLKFKALMHDAAVDGWMGDG